ncbi:MAG: hypothetical protein Q7Q73_14425 [Verrucomicrobiota bacterium JB024]|nr:hypothetical protein [Verrucomicrobiota bacterium JB024]
MLKPNADLTAPPKGHKVSHHKPAWKFMPMLEYVNGLAHDFSGVFLTMVYKTLGASNAMVGLAAALQIPLAFNALWAPMVERMGTYRMTMMRTLFAIILSIFALSGILYFIGTSYLLISAVFLGMIVLLSIFEITERGYKVSSLNAEEIALYSGINVACYRIGLMTGSTLLIYLAGIMAERHGYHIAWGGIFALTGAALVLLWVYLKFVLPYPLVDKGEHVKLTPSSYGRIFVSFVRQQSGLTILLFLFLSRFGEGLCKYIEMPFCLDPPELGGMGLNLKILGVMSPFTMASMVVAGIIGGILVKVFKLHRVLFILMPLMFIPNIMYSYLAYSPHLEIHTYAVTFGGLLKEPWMFEANLWVLAAGVIENFGYGISFAPIVVMVDLISKNAGENKATYGAIAGGILLLGFIMGGTLCGFTQEAVGYFWTYNLSVLISLPAWFLVPWLPLRQIEEQSSQIDQDAHLNGND